MVQRLTIPRIIANQEAQSNFINDMQPGWSAYVGGFGSGKTWAAARKFIICHLANDSKSLLVAPTWSDILRYQVPEIEQVCKEWGIPCRAKLAAVTEAPCIYVGWGEHPILVISGDEPRRITGFEVGCIWIDEGARIPSHLISTNDCKTQCESRLRAQVDHARIGIVSTTPEGQQGWVYEDFYEKPKPNHRIYVGRTHLNKYLPRDYVRSLMDSYSANQIKAYMDGEFVPLNNKLAHPEFDKVKHVKTIPFNPAHHKIIMGCDFNVDGMAWVIMAEIEKDFIYQFDEIYIDQDARVDKTVHAVDEKGWGTFGPIDLSVDRSSKSRSIVGDRPVDVLVDTAQKLGWKFSSVNDQGSNPPTIDKIGKVSRFLEDANGKTHFAIHPACKKSIKYMSTTSLVKGNYDKRKKHDAHLLE
mgnify:CR=1 FL=1